MKYLDVKDKIKKYFEEIDPDELYDLAISCGFKQVDKKEEELEEINNFKDETVKYVYVPLKVVETSSYKYEEDNSDYLATA